MSNHDLHIGLWILVADWLIRIAALLWIPARTRSSAARTWLLLIGFVPLLGLPADSSEKDVSKAMAAATPDQLLALKQADQDFAVRMRELDIDLEKIAASDRDHLAAGVAASPTDSSSGKMVPSAWRPCTSRPMPMMRATPVVW